MELFPSPLLWVVSVRAEGICRAKSTLYDLLSYFLVSVFLKFANKFYFWTLKA